MSERFVSVVSAKIVLHKYFSFYFLSLQTPPRSRNAATCTIRREKAECVHAYGALQPNVTSSTKPEVHDVA